MSFNESSSHPSWVWSQEELDVPENSAPCTVRSPGDGLIRDVRPPPQSSRLVHGALCPRAHQLWMPWIQLPFLRTMLIPAWAPQIKLLPRRGSTWSVLSSQPRGKEKEKSPDVWERKVQDRTRKGTPDITQIWNKQIKNPPIKWYPNAIRSWFFPSPNSTSPKIIAQDCVWQTGNSPLE